MLPILANKDEYIIIINVIQLREYLAWCKLETAIQY